MKDYSSLLRISGMMDSVLKFHEDNDPNGRDAVLKQIEIAQKMYDQQQETGLNTARIQNEQWKLQEGQTLLPGKLGIQQADIGTREALTNMRTQEGSYYGARVLGEEAKSQIEQDKIKAINAGYEQAKLSDPNLTRDQYIFKTTVEPKQQQEKADAEWKQNRAEYEQVQVDVKKQELVDPGVIENMRNFDPKVAKYLEGIKNPSLGNIAIMNDREESIAKVNKDEAQTQEAGQRRKKLKVETDIGYQKLKDLIAGLSDSPYKTLALAKVVAVNGRQKQLMSVGYDKDSALTIALDPPSLVDMNNNIAFLTTEKEKLAKAGQQTADIDVEIAEQRTIKRAIYPSLNDLNTTTQGSTTTISYSEWITHGSNNSESQYKRLAQRGVRQVTFVDNFGSPVFIVSIDQNGDILGSVRMGSPKAPSQTQQPIPQPAPTQNPVMQQPLDDVLKKMQESGLK